jgi:hypothetical protein
VGVRTAGHFVVLDVLAEGLPEQASHDACSLAIVAGSSTGIGALIEVTSDGPLVHSLKPYRIRKPFTIPLLGGMDTRTTARQVVLREDAQRSIVLQTVPFDVVPPLPAGKCFVKIRDERAFVDALGRSIALAPQATQGSWFDAQPYAP